MVLRIDFSEAEGDERLEAISLGAFFEKFEESDLEFLYQDETARVNAVIPVSS